MKAREAIELARAKSAVAQKHFDRVQDAMANGQYTGCYIFAIGSETFYYGFDGIKLHCGKHTQKRSAYLIEHGMAEVIA